GRASLWDEQEARFRRISCIPAAHYAVRRAGSRLPHAAAWFRTRLRRYVLRFPAWTGILVPARQASWRSHPAPRRSPSAAPAPRQAAPEPRRVRACILRAGVPDRQAAASFDHLVDAAEQRERDSDAERLGGLEVQEQFNFGDLLDRLLVRLLTFKNTGSVDASQTVLLGNGAAIAR